MKSISRLVYAVLALVALLSLGEVSPATAQGAPEVAPIIAKFGGKQDFERTGEVVSELAATGRPEAAPALQALAAGDLYWRKSDMAVFIGRDAGRDLELVDPVTGAAAGTGPSRDFTKVRINNALRRAVAGALGGLTLGSPDPAVRLRAAETIFASADADALPALETAIAGEADAGVKRRLEEARAAALLSSGRPAEEKAAAAETLAGRGDRPSLVLLSRFAGTLEAGEAREAVNDAIASIEADIAFWNQMQNVWFGLSLGSVLLLAAIGLAITFGVMGVINMAHGEMVMLGAYTTFVTQELIRAHAPGLFDWSLAIALPLAFLVSGTVGLAMERGIIRFLYGRPLETLLATYGVSLILQQAVRSWFGPTNKEVGNPSWMSGAFDIGMMSITWNRFWIILFALAVFAALLFALNRTSMGLQMRAVTQNRRMASAMGIRTPFVDAMTFALGSGIAGVAGVALSQIDNVSPNLGQGYIIDSFMVVVFGGVGNLWGTLVGAMSLGILNKFLEPYAGAVLGKIVVLVLIILFIQKRPRGLFAQKGRFVEA